MTANAGRADLDHLVKAAHIPAGEPVFVLRGRDPAAVAGIQAWALKARQLGVSPAVIEQALTQADAMAAWPVKQVAGDDHLSEAERKQLAYRFERRAWNARDDAADLSVMLAEERGLAAAMNRLRPVLRALFARGVSFPKGNFIYNPERAGEDGLPIEGPDAIAALRSLEVTLRGAPQAAA